MPGDWPREFTAFLARELSVKKETGVKLLEKSLNPLVTKFIGENIDSNIRQEVKYPDFPNDRNHWRIDFATSDSEGKIKFAIEAKFLPEVGATPAKFGHDLLKDLVRLALLEETISKETYFLLVTPKDFPIGGNKAKERWDKFFKGPLAKHSELRLADQFEYWGTLWHIQKNLHGYELPDMEVRLVGENEGSFYLVRMWKISRRGTHPTFLQRIGHGSSEKFILHTDKFGATVCRDCSTELYKIHSLDLSGIMKNGAELNSSSLPLSLRSGKQPKIKWFWICPKCDAPALKPDTALKRWNGRI